jgi:hypothetical protein
VWVAQHAEVIGQLLHTQVRVPQQASAGQLACCDAYHRVVARSEAPYTCPQMAPPAEKAALAAALLTAECINTR